jgi:hypothetical protein
MTDPKYVEAKSLLETLVTKQRQLFLATDQESDTPDATTEGSATNTCGDVAGGSDNRAGDALSSDGDGKVVAEASSAGDDASAPVTCDGDLGSHPDTIALVKDWRAQLEAQTITPATVSLSSPEATKVLVHLVQGSSCNLGKLVSKVGQVLFGSSEQGRQATLQRC